MSPRHHLGRRRTTQKGPRWRNRRLGPWYTTTTLSTGAAAVYGKGGTAGQGARDACLEPQVHFFFFCFLINTGLYYNDSTSPPTKNRRPPPPPTSLHDSLVGFSAFPPTTPATNITTTNESSRLVGGFFCLSTHDAGHHRWSTTTNESSRLVGGLSRLSTHDASHHRLQRVFTTRWWAFLPSTHDASHHCHQRVFTTRWWVFLAFPPTTPSITTTNESSRLVDGVFCLSTHDAGHHRHQRVFKTRWWVFTAFHPWLRSRIPPRPSPPPTSLHDSLVYYFIFTA